MISKRATLYLSHALHLGCNVLQFYPYTWSMAEGQLLPMSPWGRRRYVVNKCFVYFMGIFAYIRFVHTLSWEIPDRQRMMHILWLMVYLCLYIVSYQFDARRDEIRHFVNALGRYIAQNKQPVHRGLSVTVIAGYWFFLFNLPAHAISFYEIPCTPHYLSSVILNCKSVDSDQEPLLIKIPFLLVDSFSTAVTLFHLFFNWVIIFLGTCWLRCELQAICKNDSISDMTQYRRCQQLNNVINHTFCYHLQWLPSYIGVILISMNFVGAIRLAYLDLDAWIMFPACTVRCFIDVMAPLWSAGKVNEESGRLLAKWKHELGSHDVGQPAEKELAQKIYRSCPQLACRAGFFFKFENSIVICTLDRCAKLSTDLLLLSIRRANGQSI